MKKKLKKIFIMTTPRSGSTLLGQQLGINSRIFHIGESSYWDLLKIDNIQCSCGRINCAFIDKIAPEIQTKHLAKPLLKVWQIIDNKYWPHKKVSKGSVFEYQEIKVVPRSLKYWLSACPQALNNIIEVYSKYTPEDVFVDNTKLHNIGEKLVGYPNWKIIILLRDPRGVLCSYKLAGISKKDFRKTENVLPYLCDFMSSVKRVSSKKNVIIVRYEEFCKKPRLLLKKICNFIEVSYENNMSKIFTSDIKFRGHVIKGNRLLKAKKIERFLEDNKWKNELTSDELRSLYDYKNLVASYNRFGYNFN